MDAVSARRAARLGKSPRFAPVNHAAVVLGAPAGAPLGFGGVVMSNFREMIGGNALVEAPVVFNPLTAKLAEAAGFPAVYLGGGTFGYVQCVTAANLTL